MPGRFFVLLTAILLAIVAGPAARRGLPSHSLVGAVTDTNGNVLPGVTVELANPAASGSVRTVTTGSDGHYRIDRVLPGLYVLTLRLAGFGPVIRDIEIGGGDAEFEFDVQLKPVGSQPSAIAPAANQPQRRVVCGMTVISPPRSVDPGILVPKAPPQGSAAKPTIRAIQPTLCWERSSDSPSVQPNR